MNKTKTALVTGGSRGIGASIAKKLREDGYNVITAARTDADIITDFLDDPTFDVKQINKVDILINNVGGTLDVKDPHDIDGYRNVFALNFWSAVEVTDLFVHRMIENKWGRIINICSTSSVENNGPVPYCAAKAALAGYTHSMGRVLAPTGVVMSGLLVGAIATKDGFWDQQTEEHKARYLKERCPLGRFGEERSVADFVSFLCSDKADFFQGALIPIDGGQIRGFHH